MARIYYGSQTLTNVPDELAVRAVAANIIAADLNQHRAVTIDTDRRRVITIGPGIHIGCEVSSAIGNAAGAIDAAVRDLRDLWPDIDE